MEKLNKGTTVEVLLIGDWLKEKQVNGKKIYSVTKEPFITKINEDLIFLDDYSSNVINLSFIYDGININEKVNEIIIINENEETYYIETEKNDYYIKSIITNE